MKKGFIIICIFLSLYLAFFVTQKINFLTADLGRHVKNGEIFLNSVQFGASKTAILHTNFYSSTFPEFPFINHHWGSGILVYLIYLISGWNGLSIAYIICFILALIFSLLVARKDVPLWSVGLSGFFLVPMIASRMEVRPEVLSYLFICVFIYLLYQFSKNQISYKLLFILPVLGLLWSNIHIYFIFGVFIIGVFLFEKLINRDFVSARKLSIILGLTGLATLITPYGLLGALYPFTIFANYGYLIVENQSIPFLENLSFANPNFLWYKITLCLIVISSIIILVKKRNDFIISLSIISLTFAVLAFFGIRHLSVFALVSLPLLAYNFSIIRELFFNKIKKENFAIGLGIIFCLIFFTATVNFWNKLPWNTNFGIGLLPESLNSSQFIKNTNIHGPIFNNYDIGGSMIFTLYPKEKVFVDNRPEAYPKEFFSQTYIAMQEDDSVWQKISEKEKFNSIYFYRLDYTPWAQKFLIERVKDPEWAPVYVDSQTIIFLKRNNQNKYIIEKYELPREMFNIK